MSAHYRKIKPRHRYNEREEQMRVAMMLRRSWARYRRHVRKIPGLFSAFPWPVPTAVGPRLVMVPPGPGISGVYVWEWHNDPLDTSGGKG